MTRGWSSNRYRMRSSTGGRPKLVRIALMVFSPNELIRRLFVRQSRSFIQSGRLCHGIITGGCWLEGSMQVV